MLIIVNHSEKWVLPIDLKTSGKPEWDFHKSFNDWRYKKIKIFYVFSCKTEKLFLSLYIKNS